MQSKLPLLHSCPGGVRKSTFRGPWRAETTMQTPTLQGLMHLSLKSFSFEPKIRFPSKLLSFYAPPMPRLTCTFALVASILLTLPAAFGAEGKTISLWDGKTFKGLE